MFRFKTFSKYCLVILLGSARFSASAGYGKSFLNTPTLFRPAAVEQIVLNRAQLQLDEWDCRQGLSIVPVGQLSLGSDDLAQYFLPNGQVGGRTKLVVGELGSQAVQHRRVDLLANYFNVVTAALPADGAVFDPSDYTFESVLSFAPRQQVTGLYLNYRRHLSRYLDQGYWLEVGAPLLWIKNDLGFQEEVVNAGGGAVPTGCFSNMTAALKQADWNYGKIDQSQARLGLPDLHVKLGKMYFS